MRSRSARSAAAAVLVLAQADTGTGALGPAYGGRLTVALAELPTRFEPAAAQGAGPRLIAALVHERLIDLGDLAPKPALAQSWKAAASGREWSLRLRAGAVFHDGTAWPALRGAYLFADYCTGTVWGIDAAQDEVAEPAVLAESGRSLTSFGEDPAGEVYATDLAGELLRVTASAP